MVKPTDDAKVLVYGQETLVHGITSDKKLELDIVLYSPREQKGICKTGSREGGGGSLHGV